MGVTGLWNLVDSVGHPISLETLHNQILAIGIINAYKLLLNITNNTINCYYIKHKQICRFGSTNQLKAFVTERAES